MAKVLITGATAGIGRITAMHLATSGLEVFASSRNPEAVRKLEEDSRGRLRGVVLDVTDAGSIDRARAQIDEATGGYGIDALVNNAGYGQGGPLELLSDAELRAQYETNVFGLMAVTRAFLPAMRARRSGRIVNIGSVAGTIALPFLGAYASTKHAVQGLSDSLRRELRPHGVKVVLIRPGAIRTEFGVGEAEGLRQFAEGDSPYRRQLETFIPWHKTLHPDAPEPEYVARAVERAIVATEPRPYYVVPPSNLGVLWLQKLLPGRIVDRILERVIGLP
jgi:NAD(P)-dependent dehydrogenase (short-subunit alcohol dehydrogenase family)